MFYIHKVRKAPINQWQNYLSFAIFLSTEPGIQQMLLNYVDSFTHKLSRKIDIWKFTPYIYDLSLLLCIKYNTEWTTSYLDLGILIIFCFQEVSNMHISFNLIK